MSVVPEGGAPPGPPAPSTVRTPHRSPATSPARKRMKLDLSSTAGSEDPQALRKKLYEWRLGRLRRRKNCYRDNMVELFFLKNGTNVTDNLQQFRKKPSQQFVEFLISQSAPASVVTEVESCVTVTSNLPRPSQSYSPHLAPSLPLSPVKIGGGESQHIFSARQTASRPSQNSSLPPPSAPVLTPEQVMERTKQEGWVVRRVTELTRDGLWPARRLPQVAERARPVSAWDLVLEEMRWMATDFAQERSWKKAAARVQSAAAREDVVRRREQEQAVQLEQVSQQHKKNIARHIAAKVAVFWQEVNTCYHKQEVRRAELHHSKSLAQQGLIVSSVQPAVSLKRKHSESLIIPAAPLTPESEHENGVSSDTESSISEQESWELLHSLADTEIAELCSDNKTELAQLVRSRYPGYEEDLRCRWEEGEEDGDTLSEWETDSECEERTEYRGLGSLAQQAAALAVQPVISPGSESSQAELDWLLTLQKHNLPALLLSQNKVPVTSLLSHLVTREASPGPHLLIVPVTAISSWSSLLARTVPGLSVVQYSGGPADRRRAREEICLSSLSPNIVLTSYRTFFSDSAWFLTRPWSLLVLTETQNIISAAATDQIRQLAGVKAGRRVLLASGEMKENPIDLWNTLYLMFPSVYFQREEKSEVGVEVDGTPEFVEIKEKLLTIVTGFSYSGSKVVSPASQETKLGVPLNPSKQKLYDDYLAQTLSQDSTQRDLRAVTSAVQVLREICNRPISPSTSSSSSPCKSSLPDWCFINKSQSSVFSKVQEYQPLENISLDQVNLVFLSQEMTTTVLTSARLRSIKASKKLIQELSSSTPAPQVPRNRVHLNLESLTRNIGGGWNLGGLALGDGVSLVKAANGQVYKMTVKEGQTSGVKVNTNLQPETSLGAFHPESLETIASVNHWRCDGFPLYGQDLIKSLEIICTTRPVQSRFRGQGYVNCLTSNTESSDWRYSTTALAKICQTSSHSLQTILQNCRPRDDGLGDNKMKALHSVLYPAHRAGQKVVLVTGLESSLPAIATVCNGSGVRYCVVRGGETHARQVDTVNWWRLEPRLTVLVVVEVESHHSNTLDLSSADLLVLLDSSPGLWEPSLSCPLVRLLCVGTVEESLSRVETAKKVLQDMKTNQSQEGILSKQTVAEIVSPQPDNGYTKKREKGLSEADNSVWNIFSNCLGSSDPDIGPVQSLLDLAELETLGEVSDGLEELDEETVELLQWLEGLQPIKRFGMRLLRDNVEMRHGLSSVSPGIPASGEEDEEDAKLRWERKFLESQRQELELESLENMLTYSHDLVDREWKSGDGKLAAVWRPPGQYQADLAPMETVFSGYSRSLIPDSQLPPVHVKKEKKSAPLPIAGVICQAMSPPTVADLAGSVAGELNKNPKLKREEGSGAAPKSLFDRPRPPKMVARPRPPFSQSALSAPVQIPSSLSGQFQSLKPLLREVDAGPGWTIQEDQALHQAVISVQELGLNTTSTTNPGHTINWDMVSDMVNSVSWCFRSSKQCRARWESQLVPREEGRLTQYDNTPKKMKKDKKLGLKLDKKSSGQNMKTGALFRADNNNAFSSTFSGRFETIKTIANKRTPTTTPLLVNPTLRNPKHAAVLAESGIDYDSPVSPVQVAANRADRIQASKARTAGLPQTSNTTSASTASSTAQPVQTPSPRAATTVSLPTQPTQAVVVGISGPLSGQQQQQQPPQQGIQNSGAARPALSVQELLKTAAVSSAIMTTTGVAATMSSARIPAGQIIVSQAGKTGLVQSGTVVTNRQLTPHQLQLLKQQAIKKNQEQQLKQRLSSSSGAAVVTAGPAVTTSPGAGGGTSKVTVTGSLPAGLGRGQVIRQGSTVRNISDPEFKALLSKQPGGVKGNVVQVASNSMSAAQLQQLGLQVASSPGTSSSLVKTVSSPLVQVSPGTSKTLNISGVSGVLQASQIKAVAGGGAGRGVKNPGQQLQIQKQIQLITGQKVAGGQRVALATTGKPGQPTQLIVPGNKGAAVTVQQLQQIVKGAGLAGLAGGQGQVIGTITGQQGQQILSVKPSGNTLPARVVPVSGAAARGQQTIQVVTQQRQGAPNVTINQMGRPSTASELASALAAGSHVKIQAPQGASQQQILSQISTALAGHGQNVSVAVRTPSGSNTTVLQPQSQPGGQQRQMVNLQLSVAQPVQQQPQQQQQQQTVTTSNNQQQQNNSDS